MWLKITQGMQIYNRISLEPLHHIWLHLGSSQGISDYQVIDQ